MNIKEVDMRLFTVGERWGPLPCEYPNCQRKDALTIVLSDEENNLLPEKTGSAAFRFILSNRLGLVACDEHIRSVA
jgi:hypothetical protein